MTSTGRGEAFGFDKHETFMSEIKLRQSKTGSGFLSKAKPGNYAKST